MNLNKMNTVVLAGYIANVNIRSGQNGSYGTFTISYTDSWKDQNGNWQEKSHFFEVEVNDKKLNKIHGQLNKGDFIAIEGKLIQDRWQDKQSGQNRSVVRVRLMSVVTYLSAQAKQCLQQNGFAPVKQQGQQQGGYQGGQQGGIQGGYQGGNNQGGNQGGYQGGNNQGGFQGGNQGGNHQPNQGGYQGGYQQ